MYSEYEMNDTNNYYNNKIIIIAYIIETSGAWIKEIGLRIAAITYENRAISFLRQRLSIAVQRGNATCVLGTLSTARVVDE